MMKLRPGRRQGSPVGPRSPPTSFIIRTAIITCSGVALRLFAAITLRSALSMPSARTLPLVQWRTMLSRTSRALLGVIGDDGRVGVVQVQDIGLESVHAGEQLLHRRRIRRRGFSFLHGGVVGHEAGLGSQPEVATPSSVSALASAMMSAGSRCTGRPLSGSTQKEQPPLA